MSSSARNDLIVARATAAGPSAIAIVRLDGAGATELARKLFQPQGRRHAADVPREAIYGAWIDPDAADPEAGVIDRGLCLFMKGPHSYTGNDLAEFQCHGSAAVVRRILAACIRLGARPAEPGEFTRRAFLNGRLDLAQAEAVADLIRAETDATARAAQAQLAGGLSGRIQELRETLVNLAAEIEARIDFPEEGIEDADLERLNGMFEQIATELDGLIDMRHRGRLLREGIRVALVGEPNVGKSSLLNALARMERAIVTPHAGTTRDTIECLIDLNGVPVTLIDTAGLRDSSDPVESLGIERSRRILDEADVVIEIRDIMNRDESESSSWLKDRPPDLIVENKLDLLERVPRDNQEGQPKTLLISAQTGAGLKELEHQLMELVQGESSSQESRGDAFLVNERHAGLLGEAQTSLHQAREAWNEGSGSELVMIDLRDALTSLDEILGLTAHEAILDRIFEQFCLGK